MAMSTSLEAARAVAPGASSKPGIDLAWPWRPDRRGLGPMSATSRAVGAKLGCRFGGSVVRGSASASAAAAAAAAAGNPDLPGRLGDPGDGRLSAAAAAAAAAAASAGAGTRLGGSV